MALDCLTLILCHQYSMYNSSHTSAFTLVAKFTIVPVAVFNFCVHCDDQSQHKAEDCKIQIFFLEALLIRKLALWISLQHFSMLFPRVCYTADTPTSDYCLHNTLHYSSSQHHTIRKWIAALLYILQVFSTRFLATIIIACHCRPSYSCNYILNLMLQIIILPTIAYKTQVILQAEVEYFRFPCKE